VGWIKPKNISRYWANTWRRRKEGQESCDCPDCGGGEGGGGGGRGKAAYAQSADQARQLAYLFRGLQGVISTSGCGGCDRMQYGQTHNVAHLFSYAYLNYFKWQRKCFSSKVKPRNLFWSWFYVYVQFQKHGPCTLMDTFLSGSPQKIWCPVSYIITFKCVGAYFQR
jgi:hypothetical protein